MRILSILFVSLLFITTSYAETNKRRRDTYSDLTVRRFSKIPSIERTLADSANEATLCTMIGEFYGSITTMMHTMKMSDVVEVFGEDDFSIVDPHKNERLAYFDYIKSFHRILNGYLECRNESLILDREQFSAALADHKEKLEILLSHY